jgi:uncharacterized protein with PIN domain
MVEMRFLCDEMLQRLGRWLRAAGYDTAIAATGTADRDLVRQATAEERWLLTRDQHMALFRNGQGRVVLLEQNTVPEQVAMVSLRFAIDWLRRPFSRCLDCNTPIIPASPEQYAQLPRGALLTSPLVWYCPQCGKLYWDGSHVRRMRHTLENFSRGVWRIAVD